MSIVSIMSSASLRNQELNQHHCRRLFKGLFKKWLQPSPSAGTTRSHLQGITLAIRLSTHWLGTCQQRPGCHSYRPPSPPALAGFLLLSTLCCVPTLLLHPCLFLSKCSQTSQTSVCVCVFVWLHQIMCALIIACRTEWLLSPLMISDAAAHVCHYWTELPLHFLSFVLFLRWTFSFFNCLNMDFLSLCVLACHLASISHFTSLSTIYYSFTLFLFLIPSFPFFSDHLLLPSVFEISLMRHWKSWKQ